MRNLPSCWTLLSVLILLFAPPAFGQDERQGRLIVRVDSSEGYAFDAGGTRSVLVTQELDVPNNRVCSTGTDFIFELAKEARVTLKFFRAEGGDATGEPTLGSTVTLLQDVVYRAGENHLVITPNELPPGDYKFELTAVATEDPTLSDSFTGSAHSEFRVRDGLPVGHTLVQGVDTFDGHMTLQRLDFELPGRGPMLKFERAYSSNATGEPGPLGAGWTHNYDARLVITPCGEVVLSGGDGSSGRFVPDGQGGFRPLNGFHGSLVKNLEDNSFDYFSKNGTRHHFRFLLGSQPLWVLDSIADTNGNRVKLTHVGDAREHRLLSVEDAAGRRLQFFYTRHDFLYFTADVIDRVEGPGGLAMHFEYDGIGNLISARREDLLVERYGYRTLGAGALETRHLLTSVVNELTDDMGDVVRRRSPEGRVTTSSYDARRRVLTETIAAESVRPETTTFAYDLNGNRTLMRRPEANRLVAVTDPLLAVTTYTWDKNGNLQTQTDAHRNATAFSYDELDRPTRKEYPDGAFETTAYDENGNVAERRDAKGQVTTFAYDALNRETLASFPADPATQDDLASIARTYDENNNPLVVRETYSESGDHLTTRTFDSFDRLETVTDRWGHLIRYARPETRSERLEAATGWQEGSGSKREVRFKNRGDDEQALGSRCCLR